MSGIIMTPEQQSELLIRVDERTKTIAENIDELKRTVVQKVTEKEMGSAISAAISAHINACQLHNKNVNDEKKKENDEEKKVNAFFSAVMPQLVKWLPWVVAAILGGKVGIDQLQQPVQKQPSAHVAVDKIGE